MGLVHVANAESKNITCLCMCVCAYCCSSLLSRMFAVLLLAVSPILRRTSDGEGSTAFDSRGVESVAAMADPWRYHWPSTALEVACEASQGAPHEAIVLERIKTIVQKKKKKGLYCECIMYAT